MSKIYRVVHRVIDGLMEDRETAWPELKVEIHPMGTELPADKQGRRLVLRIGAKETQLDESGIAELLETLDAKP